MIGSENTREKNNVIVAHMCVHEEEEDYFLPLKFVIFITLFT